MISAIHVTNIERFGDVLRRLAKERDYTYVNLSRLTGLPRDTLKHWWCYRVNNPRYWQDILQVAEALRLDPLEVDQLLAPTKHPNLARLWAQASENEKIHFKRWHPYLFVNKGTFHHRTLS